MERNEMLMRFAAYCACAKCDLKDDSYLKRWAGKGDQITEEDYRLTAVEIQSRLVAAGVIAADEDPYETIMFADAGR